MSKQLTVVDEVKSNLAKMTKQFGLVLPENVKPERFVRVAQTAIQKNKDLMKASKDSLYGACMKCAEDGLLPDGKEAALVVFGNTAQYMPMVAGIKKKVRASGEIKKWQLKTVHENDLFDWEEGDNDYIRHKPCLTNRGEVIAAYSIVTYKDGEKDREVMSREEIDKVRLASRSPNAGPWKQWYEEMAKRTVARRHAKSLPMGDALTKVIESEDTTIANNVIDVKEELPVTNDAAPAPVPEVETPKKNGTSSKLSDAIETKTTEEIPI